MVYMSGGKMARHAASITNLPTCGGPKKAGLAPSIGWFMSNNPNLTRATNTQFGLKCIPNRTTQTQKYGYSATHGGNMG
ncbi:hypothetical protein N9K75_01940 [bacterium]|nr:hypothetical protein [bacterium]